MTTISNPYAWAVGYVKNGKFTIDYFERTRRAARHWKGECQVIRKVFIQPAESVRRSR
jgi:hypothetical protein